MLIMLKKNIKDIPYSIFLFPTSKKMKLSAGGHKKIENGSYFEKISDNKELIIECADNKHFKYLYNKDIKIFVLMKRIFNLIS